MESGLQKLIVADPIVQRLIGSRVYPILLPDTPVLPAATYKRISRMEEQTLEQPTGIYTARVQIDAWGETYADAQALGKAIDDALKTFAELLNDGPAPLPDGTMVSNIWLADTPPDGFDEGPRLYYTQQDYKLIYFTPDSAA